MALRGMEAYSASSGSWTSTIPPASLTAFTPNRTVRPGTSENERKFAPMLLGERPKEKINRRPEGMGDFAAAVFVVVHVGARGKDLLAEIFNAHSGIPVTTAVDGEAVERRHVYVAPADHHLLVIDGVIRLGRGPRENLARPAVDPLFRSIG